MDLPSIPKEKIANMSTEPVDRDICQHCHKTLSTLAERGQVRNTSQFLFFHEDHCLYNPENDDESSNSLTDLETCLGCGERYGYLAAGANMTSPKHIKSFHTEFCNMLSEPLPDSVPVQSAPIVKSSNLPGVKKRRPQSSPDQSEKGSPRSNSTLRTPGSNSTPNTGSRSGRGRAKKLSLNAERSVSPSPRPTKEEMEAIAESCGREWPQKYTQDIFPWQGDEKPTEALQKIIDHVKDSIPAGEHAPRDKVLKDYEEHFADIHKNRYLRKSDARDKAPGDPIYGPSELWNFFGDTNVFPFETWRRLAENSRETRNLRNHQYRVTIPATSLAALRKKPRFNEAQEKGHADFVKKCAARSAAQSLDTGNAVNVEGPSGGMQSTTEDAVQGQAQDDGTVLYSEKRDGES